MRVCFEFEGDVEIGGLVDTTASAVKVKNEKGLTK